MVCWRSRVIAIRLRRMKPANVFATRTDAYLPYFVSRLTWRHGVHACISARSAVRAVNHYAPTRFTADDSPMLLAALYVITTCIRKLAAHHTHAAQHHHDCRKPRLEIAISAMVLIFPTTLAVCRRCRPSASTGALPQASVDGLNVLACNGRDQTAEKRRAFSSICRASRTVCFQYTFAPVCVQE